MLDLKKENKTIQMVNKQNVRLLEKKARQTMAESVTHNDLRSIRSKIKYVQKKHQDQVNTILKQRQS